MAFLGVVMPLVAPVVAGGAIMLGGAGGKPPGHRAGEPGERGARSRGRGGKAAPTGRRATRRPATGENARTQKKRKFCCSWPRMRPTQQNSFFFEFVRRNAARFDGPEARQRGAEKASREGPVEARAGRRGRAPNASSAVKHM